MVALIVKVNIFAAFREESYILVPKFVFFHFVLDTVPAEVDRSFSALNLVARACGEHDNEASLLHECYISLKFSTLFYGTQQGKIMGLKGGFHGFGLCEIQFLNIL
jgi:hypothetical protein